MSTAIARFVLMIAIAALAQPGRTTASTLAAGSSGSDADGAASERAAGDMPVIIAYLFSRNEVIDPHGIAADKLTHINYAFANIADGRVVEGFANDTKNFEILSRVRAKNPQLKILISVGGWTWSGGFSDMALNAESRRRTECC